VTYRQTIQVEFIRRQRVHWARRQSGFRLRVAPTSMCARAKRPPSRSRQPSSNPAPAPLKHSSRVLARARSRPRTTVASRPMVPPPKRTRRIAATRMSASDYSWLPPHGNQKRTPVVRCFVRKRSRKRNSHLYDREAECHWIAPTPPWGRRHVVLGKCAARSRGKPLKRLRMPLSVARLVLADKPSVVVAVGRFAWRNPTRPRTCLCSRRSVRPRCVRRSDPRVTAPVDPYGRFPARRPAVIPAARRRPRACRPRSARPSTR
jgi:hypothetical protein